MLRGIERRVNNKIKIANMLELKLPCNIIVDNKNHINIIMDILIELKYKWISGVKINASNKIEISQRGTKINIRTNGIVSYCSTCSGCDKNLVQECTYRFSNIYNSSKILSCIKYRLKEQYELYRNSW